MQGASSILVMVAVAIILRGVGTGSYIYAILRYAGTRRQVEPSLVSWSLWTTAQMAAFFAQWAEQKTISVQAVITLGLGIGSGLVVVAAVVKKSFKLTFTKFDVICMFFALGGIGGGVALHSPALVLVCSICADLAAGLPTVFKAWKKPASEHRATYICSLLAAIATLATVRDVKFIVCALPIYFVCVNLLMVGILTYKKSAKPAPHSSRTDPVLVE